MGTLYIDRKDLEVRLDGNALAFYSQSGREGVVPINPLKRVIIVGNITIETGVLNKLARQGVSVIFLSGKIMRFCGMLHGSLHNNAVLRVNQYKKSISDFKDEIAREIVKYKIDAQEQFLIDLQSARPDKRLDITHALCSIKGIQIRVENETPNIDTLRGLEGSASATYFSAFTKVFSPSLGFTKRTRRPPEDPVNAMLSLCYTLIHFEAVREIEIIGLDPSIGFYHEFSYGRESLACDVVEMFRVEVDRFVWDLFRKQEFTGRDFSFESEGCYLKKDSRRKFYPLYEEWVKEIRSKIRDCVRDLARRVSDGQDTLSD